MSEIYLKTERLSLREMKADETHLLFDLDSDPEVMIYLNGGKPSSMEDCEKAMKRIRDYYDKYSGMYGLWFAENNETGEFMGWFLLRPDKENPQDTKNPELGYRLKKKFWGKGYATEASKALVEKAFIDFNCDSVFADAMKGNSASQNVMKKVGMQFIKNFMHVECFAPGADPTAVRYAITKAEWNESKN